MVYPEYKGGGTGNNEESDQTPLQIQNADLQGTIAVDSHIDGDLEAEVEQKQGEGADVNVEQIVNDNEAAEVEAEQKQGEEADVNVEVEQPIVNDNEVAEEKKAENDLGEASGENAESSMAEPVSEFTPVVVGEEDGQEPHQYDLHIYGKIENNSLKLEKIDFTKDTSTETYEIIDKQLVAADSSKRQILDFINGNEIKMSGGRKTRKRRKKNTRRIKYNKNRSNRNRRRSRKY